MALFRTVRALQNEWFAIKVKPKFGYAHTMAGNFFCKVKYFMAKISVLLPYARGLCLPSCSSIMAAPQNPVYSSKCQCVEQITSNGQVIAVLIFAIDFYVKPRKRSFAYRLKVRGTPVLIRSFNCSAIAANFGM